MAHSPDGAFIRLHSVYTLHAVQCRKECVRERVTVQEIAAGGRPTPDEAVAAVRRTAGLLGKTGDTEILRRIAEDDEFGVLEAQ